VSRPPHKLGVVGAAALSLAIMAPTAAMALNGSLAASVTGAAVPLAFLIALVTIGLVAYAFVEFARQYASAGSVYTFNGLALGSRWGFLSGWALLLTYTVFTAASAAETGAFFQSLMGLLHVDVNWWLPALVAVVIVWVLGTRDVSMTSRTALILEIVSVLAIAVLAVVIYAQGGAEGYSATPFTLDGHAPSAVALAAVFAFLSFAGFEGAATLGEETENPKRSIPRAIIAAVVVAGVFYVIVSYAQTIGFGTSPAGIEKFAGSSAPLADLSVRFAGTPLAVIIMAGATFSALACTLAGVTAASRLVMTLSRDGLLPAPLARVDSTHGVPRNAVTVVLGVTVVAVVGFAVAGTEGTTVFGYLGTIGVLSLLLVYLVTQVGAIKLFGGTGRWKGAQFAIPVAAILLLGYSLYANVYPIPDAPYNLFPYLVVAWIAAGAVLTVLRPEAVARISEHLVAQASTTEAAQERSTLRTTDPV
jgi:amino acid transporter